MTVSIIIVTRTYSENLEEALKNCLNQEFSDFEILVLPDNPFSFDHPKVKIIPTGNLSPGKKRDIALNYAKGKILAFLDDDAYPQKDWLKNVIENFKDDEIAAVAGPAITSPEDNIRQKASGLIYSSFLVSGRNTYRYIPRKRRETDDYPSCNFIVRKQVLEELGGFKTNFWPGEDTILSLEITKKLGRKIIYDPRVLVYHHRRPLFLPHLRQVSRYGLHRGYFVKRYPETSLRFSYFIPSFFVIGLLVGGFFSLIFPIFRPFYITIIAVYLLSVFLSSLNRDIRLIFFVFSGIILTHLCYGFCFIKGLFSKKLKEEK